MNWQQLEQWTDKPIVNYITLIILALIIFTWYLWFIIRDKTSEHDVEIDNIYKKLEDESKYKKKLEKEFELTKIHNKFKEKLA